MRAFVQKQYPQSTKNRAQQQPIAIDELNKKRRQQEPTSLMDFRDFTFDAQIEKGIKKNVQSSVKTVLDRQQAQQQRILQEQQSADLALVKNLQ